MLHFNLEAPVELIMFGEFISPERDWKHLTRWLREYELMIVTEGELWIADENREYCVKAGEYLIMSPTIHQHGTRICRCRFWWMHFHCPDLPATVSLPSQASFGGNAAVQEVANKLLYTEAEAPRSMHSRYLATLLLMELQRGQAYSPREDSSNAKLCERIKTTIAGKRFSEIRVKDLAHELGYHEKYLAAVFHKTEGITLKRYLIRRRIEEAKRLLLETDYSIAEVSYSLNFLSPHNFSRFFKQETGLTASEFRSRKHTV